MIRSSWYLAHEQDHTPRRWRPAVAAPVATSFATRSTALDPLPDPDPDITDQLAAGGRLAPKPHDSGAPAGNAARALEKRGAALAQGTRPHGGVAAGDRGWCIGFVGRAGRDLPDHPPSALLEPPQVERARQTAQTLHPEVRTKLRALAEAPTRQECERRSMRTHQLTVSSEGGDAAN